MLLSLPLIRPGCSDAEAFNRLLEDSLWLKRAHSVGHRRQLVELFGFALKNNALALFRHGKGSGEAQHRLAA